MISDNTFDGLVAGFYCAASDEIGWNVALGAVREAMAAFAVHLHAVDVSNLTVS